MLPKTARPWKFLFALVAAIGLAAVAQAQQESVGPQPPAPAAVAPSHKQEPAPNGEKISVPAGTRLAVVLENGISTRSAKAGDSLYFHTSFPVTQNNRVVIPVGSYIRGSLLESKRPGRIKGKGEFRLRLESLILPNGYTVDLMAAPRSADTGGRETTDSEGKVTGPGGKGRDTGTIAQTTVSGAGIGAIARGAKGAGIGAGIGGPGGLAPGVFTGRPEAQDPGGAPLGIVVERGLAPHSSFMDFDGTGGPGHI